MKVRIIAASMFALGAASGAGGIAAVMQDSSVTARIRREYKPVQVVDKETQYCHKRGVNFTQGKRNGPVHRITKDNRRVEVTPPPGVLAPVADASRPWEQRCGKGRRVTNSERCMDCYPCRFLETPPPPPEEDPP